MVNIITKNGNKQPQAHASIESTDGRKQRIEAGLTLKFDDGASGLLQMSRYSSPGRQRSAEELERAATAPAAGRDKEWANRLYGRYDAGALSLSAVYVNREVNNANSAYFTQPNALQPNRDRLANVDISYAVDAAPTLSLTTHLGLSDYAFKSYNLGEAENGVATDNVQISRARWLDADLKAVAKWRADSTLVAGAEVTRVSNLGFIVESPSMNKTLIDARQQFTRWGAYAQNDFLPVDALTLSVGLRVDGQTGRNTVFSPRLGAVYRATSNSTFKLQHGVAFRNPNAYELYYNASEIGYRSNPSLREERVRSSELTFEREFGAWASLRLSGFNNTVDKLIDFTTDATDGALVFSNIGSAKVNGLQADVYMVQRDGWRAPISATVQRGTESGSAGDKTLSNSPKALAHIALFTPRFRPLSAYGGGLSGSLFWQYIGAQQSAQEGRNAVLGGYSIVNATLAIDELFMGVSALLGVKNIFDRGYSYPLGDEFAQAGERGNARTFFLSAKVSFK